MGLVGEGGMGEEGVGWGRMSDSRKGDWRRGIITIPSDKMTVFSSPAVAALSSDMIRVSLGPRTGICCPL